MKYRRHRKESEITSVGSSPLLLIFEESVDTTEHGKNLYLFVLHSASAQFILPASQASSRYDDDNNNLLLSPQQFCN